MNNTKKMSPSVPFEIIEKELIKDAEFKAEYEKLIPTYKQIEQPIKKKRRSAHGNSR